MNDTNQLKMDDPNALRQAITNNLDFVKSLFTAPDGAATRVADFVDEYLRPDGIISRDKTRIDQNQEHLDDRIDVLNTRMDAREQFLRNEYNSIAEQLLALSSQTQAIEGIGNGTTTGLSF